MTNEAPTKKSPKFHEKNGEYCFQQTEDFDQTYGMMCPIDYQELTDYARKLETHIAALEAKLAEQIREDEMRLINHCVKMMGNNSKSHIHAEAKFLTKIAELEAENKRLVDAIKGVIRVADRKTVEFYEAKAAIAQSDVRNDPTGEK